VRGGRGGGWGDGGGGVGGGGGGGVGGGGGGGWLGRGGLWGGFLLFLGRGGVGAGGGRGGGGGGEGGGWGGGGGFPWGGGGGGMAAGDAREAPRSAPRPGRAGVFGADEAVGTPPKNPKQAAAAGAISRSQRLVHAGAASRPNSISHRPQTSAHETPGMRSHGEWDRPYSPIGTQISISKARLRIDSGP